MIALNAAYWFFMLIVLVCGIITPNGREKDDCITLLVAMFIMLIPANLLFFLLINWR